MTVDDSVQGTAVVFRDKGEGLRSEEGKRWLWFYVMSTRSFHPLVNR